MSIGEDKVSDLYLPSFVSTLDAHDLKNIQDCLLSSDIYDNEVGITKEIFCELLTSVLTKGENKDYSELFDTIDISREGYINWDRFSSHLLLEYYEKEYRVKHSKVPQWVDLKYVGVPHRTCICKIMLSAMSYRYCTVSKDGMMCLMDGNFKLLRTAQVCTNPEEVRAKDLWITDAVLMPNLNKIAFSNTSKEILIYDLATKTEFNCTYKMYDLKYIPLCITYWSNPDNVNQAMMAYGDVNGGVHVLIFKSATLSLFDKPLKDSDQQICFELSLQDVIIGKYQSVSYMLYEAHSSWVRQISYQPFLDCFISSSTTTKDSMVLSWLGKSRNDSRLSKFAISIGINGFDYHERMCIIATAGINNHVCLWNPYVVSKPVGRLEGHVQVVVGVQFIGVNSQLLSFAKDNVLRVWDANNQTCLQTLTGVFPRSLNADFFMMFDKERSSLVASFNHQLVVMKKKIEINDRVLSHKSPVTKVIFNEKFGQIISVCEGSCITMWLLSTGQKVKQINDAHGDAEITAITLDLSQTHILTGGTDGMIKKWDINGNCYNVFIVDGGNPCEINEIIYLKRTILAFGWSKSICCFNISQMNSYYVYPALWKGKQNHYDDILAADFVNPKHLVTASYDGDIVFWNTSTQNSSRKIANAKTKSVSLPPLSNTPEHSTRVPSARQTQSRSSSRLRCRAVSGRRSRIGARDSLLRTTSPNALLRSPDRTLRASNNLAVTSIAFLKSRDNRDPRTADIYSCHADGHIRFWNSLTCESVAEFIAFEQFGSIASCVDTKDHYLGVGGESGACKIWDISDYCNALSLPLSPPPDESNSYPPTIVTSFIAHVDAVTCANFIHKKDLLLFVTASCDCSVAMYNFSTLIGIFGQEDHWNINDETFLSIFYANKADEFPGNLNVIFFCFFLRSIGKLNC